MLLALLGGSGLACCQWLIFFHAPMEESMGIIQKIFYMHLPLAWWALISFFVLFTASIAYLWHKNQGMDQLCQAAAELGVLFAGLSLATGMIWAKKSWGVWWTWDPRLSTTLIMWFIYTAYLVIRNMDMPERRRSLVCAVIGIVAFLDVPLVFFSARIFRSIHPAVFASREGGLDPDMRITVLAVIACMGCLWTALLWTRKRQLAIKADMEKWRYGNTGFY